MLVDTPVVARYLVEDACDDARAALMHTDHLWPRWSTLTECVRKATSVTYEEMKDRGDEWTTAFIAAMQRNASFRVSLVVRTGGTDSSQAD